MQKSSIEQLGYLSDINRRVLSWFAIRRTVSFLLALASQHRQLIGNAASPEVKFSQLRRESLKC